MACSRASSIAYTAPDFHSSSRAVLCCIVCLFLLGLGCIAPSLVPPQSIAKLDFRSDLHHAVRSNVELEACPARERLSLRLPF